MSSPRLIFAATADRAAKKRALLTHDASQWEEQWEGGFKAQILGFFLIVSDNRKWRQLHPQEAESTSPVGQMIVTCKGTDKTMIQM